MPSAKRTQQPSTTPPVEIVDPVWLIRALAISLAAALFCAWFTACLLFYQGAWQLVLHPSRTVDRTPANVGLTFTPVRFGDFNTGQPHLTGWWIPVSASSTALPPSTPTALYLHGGSGSLSDTLPAITLLHSIGLNVFAIDYRGFGASDSSQHPDADRMAEDAAAALDYLTSTKHIPANSIVPMGSGLGAAFAIQLAHNHPELPALILDNPDPDPAATAAAARPSRVIPVRLLFGDRFAIASPLATLATPKLLVSRGAASSSLTDLFHRAADPKYTVTLSPVTSDAELQPALRRFLDQYLQSATPH